MPQSGHLHAIIEVSSWVRQRSYINAIMMLIIRTKVHIYDKIYQIFLNPFLNFTNFTTLTQPIPFRYF